MIFPQSIFALEAAKIQPFCVHNWSDTGVQNYCHYLQRGPCSL